MKNSTFVVLYLAAVLHQCALFAQNTDLQFSSVNAGFEVLPSLGTTASGAVGQVIVEDAQQLNTHIESGFLVYARSRKASVQLTSASDSVAPAGILFDVKFPISPNLITFAESLYYRRGGEYVYVGDTLHRDVDTLRGRIPASFATIRGIEYYIILRVGGTTVSIVTYPGVNPILSPATLPVAVGDAVYPLELQRKKYSMVSIPLDLNFGYQDIFSVLGDDYGGTYSRNHWRVFRWQKGDCAEYPGIASSFTPGASFWLITQSARSFTTGSGLSVFAPPGAPSYPIVLDQGWNQIADPYAFPISWASILQNSQIADTVLSRPNGFDGTEYEVTNILKPWEGYFVYNPLNRAVTLFISPKESPPGLPPSASRGDRHDPGISYALNLTAEMPEVNWRDSHNLLGFLSEQTPMHKRINDPEPPPIGEYVRLSIVDRGMDFMSRLMELPDDGQTWNIELYSTAANRVARVTLSQVGDMPEGFQLYILDRDNFNLISLTENQFSIQLGQPFQKRLMTVIVGTKEYAKQHSGGIPLLPLSYELEQNYPNPFNPATSIRYQLSKRSDVFLEIVDLLGQRVKTLVNVTQLTGSYTVVWDGRNDVGLTVASGVYVYRLFARGVSTENRAEFIASRKLLIVR